MTWRQLPSVNTWRGCRCPCVWYSLLPVSSMLWRHKVSTILRGVHLKEYLTFRALVSKVGPSVHIASMVATLLSRLVTSFQGIYENESRTSEMLAAACAVGVASCFAAPVGGVLFSIEVTTTYFAVRNYWRGFFAACVCAIMFRLLSVWSGATPTVKPLFPTSLPQDFPFDPQEFAVFVLLGIVCGLMAALWVWLHRHRFIYPGIMTLVIMSIFFPPGIGKYMAGGLGNQPQWRTGRPPSARRHLRARVQNGRFPRPVHGRSNALLLSAGCCVRRSYTENITRRVCYSRCCRFHGRRHSHGLNYCHSLATNNGGGASSQCGRGIVAAILFRQHYPDQETALSSRPLIFSQPMTYQQLKDILKENKAIKSFPLVDRPASMVLLGSIHRWELVKVIEQQVGRSRRLQVAAQWQKEAERRRDEERKRVRRPSRFEYLVPRLVNYFGPSQY
ncbi:unnamed protein product [Leptidea sinapis]|uniref:Chloride channel protein n=1 Tax=Leptidea sinapis TaxID=189913 RepID=A0A5E4R7L3_9NEOP|nr:unnamed protein product [Leptidea sinapis]